MPSNCGMIDCKKGKITAASKALQCEICEQWWHILCAEVDDGQYTVLHNGINGIHWFCRYCNVGCAKVMQLLGQVRQELAECKTELAECKTELADCKDDTVVIKKQLLEARFNYDRLEQHGRKGSVRISGLTDPHTNDEDTDQLVIKLAEDCGLNLKKEDISVSHRLGSKEATCDRSVIVKFVSRNNKRLLMMKKKALKEKAGYGDVYINEDITTNRYKLMKYLRDKEKKVTWSRDGKMFFKDNKDAKQITMIDTFRDLCKLNWDDKKLADMDIFQCM